jgi:FMN-dependent NADH-azoreductase
MHILHIDLSIQGAQSASRAIGAIVVEQLTSDHPDAQVVYRDLAVDPVAHLTLDVLGDPASSRELQDFLAADVVVIGGGMYNFTIASHLKSWIDRILIAGQTFRYEGDGPVGLAGDKRVVIALAKGGVYTAGSSWAPLDHAEGYLRSVFAFIGVTDLEIIVAEGLALGEEQRALALAGAIGRAGAVGSRVSNGSNVSAV